MTSITMEDRATSSELEKKAKWLKTAKWIYWILTSFFTVTMIMAGVAYLAEFQANVDGITKLGYPLYILKILGVAKILGGIGILQNRFRTIKEWAYAGYTFNLIGAAASHLFSDDGFGNFITPIIILFMVLISYRQWKTGWM